MNILPSPAFFSELLEMDKSSKDERQAFIRQLPRLEEKDVAPDDTCAICQETLLAVIAAEEMASVMESPGLAEEDMGVVKLPGCGHHFCRKDIATWVYSSHSTCPACRRDFLPESIGRPPSDPTEPFSLAEARELVRVLQLQASGIHADADDTHHNPFSEGTMPGATGERAQREQPDLDELRRVQDEFMRAMFASEQRGQSEPRESFGMYS